MITDERAWLIERPGIDGPEWFFARDKGDGQTAFGWSNDANEAVKFETRDEADAWRRELARIILTFRKACRELWGIDVPLDAPARQGCIAYGMGDVATAQLKEKIVRGEIETFPPAPATPKPSRAELTAKTVEKRAMHAAKMLTRAEKRSKAAQRALTKWREKVRYYERQAAKKATS
jgi:hypothetical protein